MEISHLLDKKFILNDSYIIKQDLNRILLATIGDDYEYFHSFIHPVHALLLSKFKGDKTLLECLKIISDDFSITEDTAFEILIPFIDNQKMFGLEYENQSFVFPKKIIIENTYNRFRNDIKEENFYLTGPFDFKKKRLNIPTDTLFIINTQCFTDCIYCYADKKTAYKALSTRRILEIIEEAQAIGMLTFDISGGELFLHKDCLSIFSKVIECGFNPFISTKVPLDNALADSIVKKGLTRLQFSLDTLNTTLANKTLGVREDYPDRVKQTIRHLDNLGVELTIKSTFTKFTFTEENIDEIMVFLSTLKHVKEYSITLAGSVLYKPLETFHNIRPTLEQKKSMSEYLNKLKQGTHITIRNNSQAFCKSDMNNYAVFKGRSACAGNIDGFIILPDGKVSICEELYWNPKFIIGDLNTDNIQDVWNSEKAHQLWNIRQEQLSEENQCKKCQDFDNCRFGSGVCWKAIIMAYGNDKYQYPDPRCPRAPKEKYEFYYPFEV